MIDVDNTIYEKLNLVPKQPGVYIFKDDNPEILYIGKAADLNNRVRAYFSSYQDTRAFINFLKPRIKHIDFMITDTEKEALLLENNLIKKYKPKYNIRLKDDKTYVHIRINAKHKFPGIYVVRRPMRDGSHIFGPYSSAYAARETIKLITRLFKLRTCSDAEFKNRIRPCLKYEINRCSAPCVNRISKDEYTDYVRKTKLFLEGKVDTALKELRLQMKQEAGKEQFEKATQIRDLLFNIEKTIETQKVELGKNIDADIFNLSKEGPMVVMNGLFIRSGQMINSLNYTFNNTMLEQEDLLSSAISQYYENGHFIPDVLYVPFDIPELDMIVKRLSDLKGRRVKVIIPEKGKNLELIRLSAKNASEFLHATLKNLESSKSSIESLKQLLHLKNLPESIECFDNSNIMGTNSVSSMVRFENGIPVKAKYRHYRLLDVKKSDDYAMMHEVLSRRYADSIDVPSLIIVDGGKGQLSIAMAVLKKLGITYPDVIGIAKARSEDGAVLNNQKVNKEEDRVYIPNRKEPVNLEYSSEPLLFLKRIRDEAHRFAITYHRQLRSKTALRSELDGIPGVSEKRKRLLLSIFNSIDEIRHTTPEEISKRTAIPINVANEIHEHLSI